MSSEIRGWLHESEQLALRRWCFQKEVLELGPYEGLSTCNISLTAKGIVTVDAFDGRGTPDPKDTYQLLVDNLQKIEGRCPVQIHKGTFAEVLPRLDRQFDLIFIDGAHDYDSVKSDIELAAPLLREGGCLIFHDYATEFPGVVQAIDELVQAGATPVAQDTTLVMVRLDAHQSIPQKPKVVIAMPHRDGWACYGSVMAASAWPSKKYSYTLINRGNSILTLTFNDLWCEALNLRDSEGFTHFAMLHNDVVPEQGWLDVLMDELVAHELDVISAVVPIKNGYGLTSTATDTPGYPWGVRRLTMKELHELPPTFTAKDVPYRAKDAPLLLNSGCWLMKFNEPWVQGLCFRQTDRVVWCEATQSWAAQSISEDWDFSRQLHSRGCRMGATRKVSLYHQIKQYNNHTVWGEWQVDHDFLKGEEETAKLKAKEGPHEHDALRDPDVS